MGKRKRELGAGVGMTTSAATNDQYDSPSQPRKTPAYQDSTTTHEYCDDGDVRGSAGVLSCKIVQISESLRYNNDKVVSSTSPDSGYVLSDGGESDSCSTCDSASPFASEGASCAPTSAVVDDDEEGEYVSKVGATDDWDPKPEAMTSPPSHLLRLGPDLMVLLVRFLEPDERLRLITMPLCKEWRRTYTAHQDMWKTLCCEDPFSAKLNTKTISARCASSLSPEIDSCSDDDEEDSFCELGEIELTGMDSDSETNYDVLGEYRLLYTSFVRCMKYLDRIKNDAQNGRLQSKIDHGNNKYDRYPTFGVTKSLKKFLAKKKHISLRSVIGDGSGSFQSHPPTTSTPGGLIGVLADDAHIQQVGLSIRFRYSTCGGVALPFVPHKSPLLLPLLSPHLTKLLLKPKRRHQRIPLQDQN
jgi:hypothetical protein